LAQGGNQFLTLRQNISVGFGHAHKFISDR
jgi:hypothetical protein